MGLKGTSDLHKLYFDRLELKSENLVITVACQGRVGDAFRVSPSAPSILKALATKQLLKPFLLQFYRCSRLISPTSRGQDVFAYCILVLAKSSVSIQNASI